MSKKLRKTRIRKVRSESRTQFIHGKHACESVLNSKRRKIFNIFIDEAENTKSYNFNLSLYDHFIQRVPKRVIERMCQNGDRHQGIIVECGNLMNNIQLDELLSKSPIYSGFALLDGINDPHNIGAIIRSACCFDIKGVFITSRNSPDINCTVVRTSVGASEMIPIYKIDNPKKIINLAKENNITVIALDSNAKKDKKMDETFQNIDKALIILGSETGISNSITSLADELICIPSSNKIDSLNVSNAAAIAFYEWYNLYR